MRHYAAPRSDGKRFVQTDADQLDLLADVFGPDVARVQNGYLMAQNVRDPVALVDALTARFESIRVGVHEGVQVILGYDFEGSVADSEQRRIAQVFTSTVAGGWYGGAGLGGAEFEGACRQLLRAAYLGTLLAAVSLGQRLAVLTLIGGGVFGNPIPLIWDAILWAAAETEPLLSCDLDVIVNGRNLGEHLPRETITTGVRERGGALFAFPRPACPRWCHSIVRTSSTDGKAVVQTSDLSEQRIAGSDASGCCRPVKVSPRREGLQCHCWTTSTRL